MLSEHERNMNLMRALLELHEEGATDELTDCAADGKPWTEEDRRKSRATADWLRATFFPPPKPRKKSRLRRAKGEQLFTDERLWAELEIADSERREAAVAAIDALAQLASLRAKQRGTSFIEERQWIYDIERLHDDVKRGDVALHAPALRVGDDVGHLQGLIAIAEEPITDEDRAWATKVRESLLAKIAEMERAAEKREQVGES